MDKCNCKNPDRTEMQFVDASKGIIVNYCKTCGKQSIKEIKIMDKLLFDARCKRCGSINEIDFNERAGGETPVNTANKWLLDNFEYGFVNYCPKCNLETVQYPVTLVKDIKDNG